MTKDTKDVKETKLQDKNTRVKRSRLKRAGPMFIDDKHLDRDKYHYYIENDDGRSVQDRIAMGYEIVQDSSVEIGDQTTANSKGLGSAVTKTVDRNGTRGVLMRIRHEDRAELLEEHEEENNAVENTLGQSGIDPKDVYGGVTRHKQ